MTSVATYINFFQAGGFFMFPILLVLAVATAIVVERIVVIARAGTTAERLWGQIAPCLQGRRMDDAVRHCTQSSKPLHQVLAAGIRGMKGSFTREDAQGSVDEAMMQAIPRLEARLSYLPNLANVATLLGLLGTIVGLIQAFTAVSMADPSQKATLLAKGISVAMNTTAFGLIVAVPLMLVHGFLQSRTNRVIDTVEEYSLRLVNLASQMARDNASDGYSNGSEMPQPRRAVGMVKGVAHAK
jgi:biopolymer transport protein ExbB/TolQ